MLVGVKGGSGKEERGGVECPNAQALSVFFFPPRPLADHCSLFPSSPGSSFSFPFDIQIPLLIHLFTSLQHGFLA